MFRRLLSVLGLLLMAACAGDSNSDKPDQGGLDVRADDAPNIIFRDSGHITPLQDGAVDALPDQSMPDQALPDTVPAICKNGAKDPGESDADCGGGGCPLCVDGKACLGGENCESGVCTNNSCQVPTCQDQVKNGGETGKDCGGTSTCGPCPDGGGCLASLDCQSLVCTNKICQTATCGDNIKNADEPAVDCGGHCGATCGLDSACAAQSDCESRFCSATNVCAVGANCQALRDGGVRTNGVYTIDPNGPPASDAVPAFCDMTTDGLGWTALAANGEIATAETTDPNDCYPLISNNSSAGCGDSSSLMNDFTLPGAQQAALSWRRLLAVAYGNTGYGDKLAYFAIDFGSAAPTAEERLGGSSYAPSALVTVHGLLRCNNEATMRIVHYTKAGTYVTTATYLARGKGTIFGHNTAPDMSSSLRRTFGFTDAGGATTGVDDYQDGWSCSDIWIPQAVRGQRMVVLVN